LSKNNSDHDSAQNKNSSRNTNTAFWMLQCHKDEMANTGKRKCLVTATSHRLIAFEILEQLTLAIAICELLAIQVQNPHALNSGFNSLSLCSVSPVTHDVGKRSAGHGKLVA
jgi:hypothetical protein